MMQIVLLHAGILGGLKRQAFIGTRLAN